MVKNRSARIALFIALLVMLVNAQTFGSSLVQLPTWMTIVDLIQASLSRLSLYPDAHNSFKTQADQFFAAIEQSRDKATGIREAVEILKQVALEANKTLGSRPMVLPTEEDVSIFEQI